MPDTDFAAFDAMGSASAPGEEVKVRGDCDAGLESRPLEYYPPRVPIPGGGRNTGDVHRQDEGEPSMTAHRGAPIPDPTEWQTEINIAWGTIGTTETGWGGVNTRRPATHDLCFCAVKAAYAV